MDKEASNEDKTINRLVKTIFRLGIEDKLDDYISHEGTTISIIIRYGIGMEVIKITQELYQKVLSRLKLRNKITPKERKQCMNLISFLLGFWSYENIINGIRETEPGKTSLILKDENKLHVVNVSFSSDVILDIINEHRHDKNSYNIILLATVESFK